MNDFPLISVLLPVYNCEKYIEETLNSVLNQSYTNFELIIIDDCSTDKTVSKINQFSDSRICFYQKEQNSGYTDSLNYGISISKGKYIARMDGDDICMPQRFEKQIEFLENNPEIILCGTALKFIGSSHGNLIYPKNHDEILINLFCFLPAFGHPTVMGKKEIFEKNNYNKNFEPAEDYELWTRIVEEGKVANLNEVLLEYRVHTSQISNTKKEIQDLNSYKSRIEILNQLNLNSKYNKEEIIHYLVSKNRPFTIEDCEKISDFYNFVIQQNNNLGVFDKQFFNEKLLNIKIQIIKDYFNRKRIVHPKNLSFLFRKMALSELIILIKMKFYGK